jgi:hypothetical protein
VVLPNGKWAAIVAILALQAYLVLAPNGRRRTVLAHQAAAVGRRRPGGDGWPW